MGEAALPLVTAAALMTVAILMESSALYVPLAIAAAVASGLAYRKGYSLKELAKAGVSGMAAMKVALSILVLVALLIGVWKASGTVPAMIYYGLGLAEPSYLVPAAFVLSLATSMMLGTSIGTLSTLGVAIMGMGQGVGVNPALLAGALVSGALFGDRSSPLAGSLNLNVAMTGTDLRRMLTVLMPTGITAAVLALGAYILMNSRVALDPAGSGTGMREAIGAAFVISPWLLVPPVLVLLMAFLRVPVRWALGCGIVSGGLLGVLVGGVDALEPVRSAVMGYASATGNASMDLIFSGGGLVPMLKQITLLLVAGVFSGIMEKTGMLTLVISRLVESVHRPLALVSSTMAISTAVALVAGNQALPIIISGRMLRPVYEREGLSPELLSRSLADSGTVLSGVIPWNLMGILASASLGISVRAFLPYAIWALILPFVSLAFTAVEERRGLSAFRTASNTELNAVRGD
ncbi:MAG TPA: Na+/H+ antiporter NhaC family protein [Symbiobacteriaceae bacterium]|nr:Na+/H+ antiporter NhaC family protein [Symbiobacteriaceae bacterium]